MTEFFRVQNRSPGMENKPANILVVPLGRAFRGIPPSWVVDDGIRLIAYIVTAL